VCRNPLGKQLAEVAKPVSPLAFSGLPKLLALRRWDRMMMNDTGDQT
jgi:hypothetical protein